MKKCLSNEDNVVVDLRIDFFSQRFSLVVLRKNTHESHNFLCTMML